MFMAIIQLTFKNGSVSSKNAESIADKLRPGKRYLLDIASVENVHSSFYDALLDFSASIIILDKVSDQEQKKLWDTLYEKYKDSPDSREKNNNIYRNTNEQLRPYGRKIPSKLEVWYKNAMPQLGDAVYDARIAPKGFKVYPNFKDGFEHWKEFVRNWHDEQKPGQEHYLLLFGLKEYMGPRLHGGGMFTEAEVYDIYRSYHCGEVPFKLFRIKEGGTHEEIDTSPPARFTWTALMEKYRSNVWGGHIIPSIYIISKNDVYTSTDSLPSAKIIFQKRLKIVKERTYSRFAGFGIDEKDIFTSTKDNLEETIEKVRQSPGNGLGEFIVQIKKKSYFWLNTVLSKEKFEQIQEKDTKAFQSKKFYTLDDLIKKYGEDVHK